MRNLPNAASACRPVLWMALGTWLVLSTPVAAQTKLRAMRELQAAGASSVVISPDGRTLAAGVWGNTIQLWNVASGEQQASLKVDYDVYSVAFSPDGKSLASGMRYNNVKLWNVATGKSTTLLHNPEPKVQSTLVFACPWVVFSPNGKILASGGRCIDMIRLWDVSTGKETAALEWDDSYGVRTLAFTPDSKILASVGDNGVLKLWDVASGKNTSRRQIAPVIDAAAISPDGKTLAAVYEVESEKGGKAVTENGFKLWDIISGKEQAALKYTDTGTLAFSPDGKTLAFGSRDGTITLWNITNGKEQARLSGHTDAVWSLAFGSNGNLLASSSKDKTVKLWDLANAK